MGFRKSANLVGKGRSFGGGRPGARSCALSVAWQPDADPEFGEMAGEQWLALLPKKWNPPRQLLYGWRYDPREFAAPPTARDERIRGATRATE